MHGIRSPAELLQLADRVLKSLQPAMQAHFYCDGWSLRARWDYPGILSVYERNSGVLLARSRRGQPTKLAAPRKAVYAPRY
jgi:hypothetical protein